MFPTRTEVDRIKDKYQPGTKIHATVNDPQLKTGDYTVDFVDDAGQIHTKESGIAVNPQVDKVEYVCNTCGKAFDYPPAISRFDGEFVCRVCSANEALDAANIKVKEPILAEIKENEYGNPALSKGNEPPQIGDRPQIADSRELK